MSDDWANGPAAAPTLDKPAASNPPGEQWSRPTERSARSASPRRSDGLERSRSPGLGDRIGAIRDSQASDRGRSSDVVNPGNNLHVSGISLKADDRDLEELFSKYGQVIKSQLMRDPHSREVRGFGFVTMATCEQAEVAITSLNGTEFMGKVLCVEKARRSRGRTPTPGEYRGPAKREDSHRPYEPRGGYYYRYDPYERRYDDYRRRDYDDPRYGRREYDERRYRYDERSASGDRYGYAAPMRERYDERYDRRRDDRDYDRRRY